jgi:replicative DNA helicase
MTTNPFESTLKIEPPRLFAPEARAFQKKKQETYLPDVHRALPSDKASEMALLSSVMQDETAFILSAEKIKPEIFHLPAHGIMWEAIEQLRGKKKPADLITVTNHLEKMGKLDECGGASYVTEVYLAVPTASNWSHFADLCHEKFRLREMIRIGTEMAEMAYDSRGDINELQSRAEEQIKKVAPITSTSVRIGDVMNDRIDQWELAIKTQGKNIQGQLTGIESWDKATMGCRGKTVHIISGDAKAGKTTLAVQMILHPAIECNTPIGVFSMEMSLESMVDKMVCGNGRVPMRKLLMGQCTPEEMGRLSKSISTMMEAPIYIDNEPTMTPSMFRAKATRMKLEHHVGLIAIDYVQLMDGDDTRKNREQQVNEIGKMMKIVAKELDVPIIIISQLNDDGKLRESRSLKMHADTVTKISVDGDRHIVEIEYNRDGPCTKIPCTFFKEHGRFEEIVEQQEAVEHYQDTD